MTYSGMCRNIQFQAANGATVSIAVGSSVYCEPRTEAGPYTRIEAGFPGGIIPESWMEYAEDLGDPHYTVYGYMPCGLLADWFIANKE